MNATAEELNGLNKEERAEWEAWSAGFLATGSRYCRIEDAGPASRRTAFECWKAARSPLEAENKRLCGLVDEERARIKTLESQLAQAHWTTAPRKPEYWEALRWAAGRVSSRGNSQVSGELAAPFYKLACEIEDSIGKEWGTNGPGYGPTAPDAVKTGVRPGIYRIFWKDEKVGSSMASVGCDRSGRNWFAPTNWLVIPWFDWSGVESIDRISDAALTAPAELPEVGTKIEVNTGKASGQCGVWHDHYIRCREPNGHSGPHYDGGRARWNQSPTETTARPPHPDPNAPPPVETSRENFNACLRFRGLRAVMRWFALAGEAGENTVWMLESDADVASEMDVRAAMAAEREKGERFAKHAEARVDRWRAEVAKLERVVVQATSRLAELEVILRSCTISLREHDNDEEKLQDWAQLHRKIQRERDDALAEVERLRGELAKGGAR